MKTLHISYAAFDSNNFNANNDYVRARSYPVIEGENFNTTTEIPPASFNTNLFKTGETYKITVIKTSDNLYFKLVSNLVFVNVESCLYILNFISGDIFELKI